MSRRKQPSKHKTQVWDLAQLIQQFHLKHRRVFTARRAYDMTLEAVAVIWPRPPVKKPRGKAWKQ